jgi:hypothetical protein
MEDMKVEIVHHPIGEKDEQVIIDMLARKLLEAYFKSKEEKK